MCSFSEEMFLRDYFTFDVVVGRFCSRRAIFDCLAKSYYIDRNRADRLFALATSQKVSDVATLKDYNQYCRLCMFSKANGLDMRYTAAEDDVLAVKGKVLTVTHECGLTDTGNTTKAGVYTNIVDKARAGLITALRLYGVLQCEGIFFEKRPSDGIKNLTRAARWNSIESLLALILYDEANRKMYTDMLYTLAANTPYEDISARVQSYCGTKEPKRIKECILLSKVFGRGQIKEKVYLPVYANLLYSEIIPFKDKEKLLLSESKEAIASYVDLPLKLARRKLYYDVSAIADLPLAREEEQNSIIQNALNSDIRHFGTFKPLCLCSDSKYMRGYYMNAIARLFVGAHIEKISVADLGAHDFEPGMNNVFVRSCNEDKSNVFIISLSGDIDDGAVKAVCDFLQGDKRAKTRLMRPGIELDLGSVLPVCFCDRRNAQMLSGYCDKVEIANPDRDEQAVLLRGLIAEKERQYGIKGLEVEDGVLSKLCALTLDAADSALDIAITANRSGERHLRLTEANASKYIKKRETSRGFGYGGSKDDN